jgi:glucose-1-phosphate thymidylyltransferase
MIYYPIASLMLAGLREIIIVTTVEDQESFKRLLGDGSFFGVKLHYVLQSQPRGIVDAFLISESIIKNEKVCLILGDNIFHGHQMGTYLSNFTSVLGAQIFGYRVSNPEEYGVAELDANGKIISIEEKPKFSKSNLAIPGLYFYDETVVEKAKQVKPSKRGELEISELNLMYLRSQSLTLQVLPRGTAWLDTGSFSSMHDASSYIKAIEDRQGQMVSCIEEIAYRNNWIDKQSLLKRSDMIGDNFYSRYLRQLSDS